MDPEILAQVAKYASMGNMATLSNQESKWQEALATYQHCIDNYNNIGEERKQNVAVLYSQQARWHGRANWQFALH